MHDIEKHQITNSVRKVMDFFGIAASVDGQTVTEVRSQNQIGKASGKRDVFGQKSHSQLWRSVNNFEETRYAACAVIVGINDENVETSLKCIDRPFLLIPSNDLNSKNFTKQLGRIMLESSFIIIIRTGGLERSGSQRLLRFLKNIKDLFDSRVRVVLCVAEETDENITNYIEQMFTFEPSLAIESSIDSNIQIEKALKKTRVAEEKVTTLQAENTLLINEKSVLSGQVYNLGEELKIQKVSNQELAEKNEELLRANSVLAGKVRKATHDFELAGIQHKQAMEVLENKFKAQQIESESLRANLDEHSAQQQKEGATSDSKDSDISKIKDRLAKYMSKELSSVTKTNKCIKDFKYSTEYEKDKVTGIIRSNVTITKGRIIMNYPDLTHFSGEGYDEESSKEKAFNNFIWSVMNSV